MHPENELRKRVREIVVPLPAEFAFSPRFFSTPVAFLEECFAACNHPNSATHQGQFANRDQLQMRRFFQASLEQIGRPAHSLVEGTVRWL